jgi:hypothetical protein
MMMIFVADFDASASVVEHGVPRIKVFTLLSSLTVYFFQWWSEKA